jgi:D-alanyl-D-alanine carboxypeptidase
MSSSNRSVGAVVALAMMSAAAASPCTAGPALLYDPGDDQILYAEDIDHTWFPASLTKMMTAYVVFDAVKAGKIGWEDKLPLSEKARGQPATRIGLRLGIEVTINQAVRGLILRSANDFAMALAEAVGGSEEGFAELMNATAKKLGMTRSHFRNPHGLPDPEQVTTARDMAILARALMKDHPDRADVFSNPQVLIHRQTMHSSNDLLRTLEGANGMKTGFTCGAGYNIVASASRDGRTLIAVVMGEPTRASRSERTSALIEYGFQRYAWKKMLPAHLLAAHSPDAAAPAQPIDVSGLVRIRKCAAPVKGGRPVVAKAPSTEEDEADAEAQAAGEAKSAASRPGKAAAAKSPVREVPANEPPVAAAAQ